MYPNQLHLIHPSPSLSDNQHTLSSSSIPLASPCYTKGCPHSLSHSHPHCLHCGTSTACSCAARFPALPARNLPGSAMDSKILQVMRSPSAMRHCTVVHAATRGRPCQCPARSGTTQYSTGNAAQSNTVGGMRVDCRPSQYAPALLVKPPLSLSCSAALKLCVNPLAVGLGILSFAHLINDSECC